MCLCVCLSGCQQPCDHSYTAQRPPHKHSYGGCDVKLYDSRGSYVDSGILTSDGLYAGATITDTAYFYKLTPGEYIVEFVPFY